MHYARTASTFDEILEQRYWQPLEEHLTAVSAAAAKFASEFGAEGWASLAGLWHDLGKYHPDFQRMLEDIAAEKPKRRVDHSTAGALLIWRKLRSGLPGHSHWLLTATIAGHHSGLADGIGALKERVEDPQQLERVKVLATQDIPPNISSPRTDLRTALRIDQPDDCERIEFLTRFIFSALVDADRLDAERFQDKFLPENQQRSPLRRYRPMAVLRQRVDAHIDDLTRNSGSGPVQIYREAVLSACRDAAELSPGAFRLNVETGGGKTLSSLSFALRHAENHGKRRVIVVIPYTSIIEQTAEVFREALGPDDVIEHHSAVEEGSEGKKYDGAFDASSERRRLAAENWDAPIIVTTAVQFFESLYSASPSRCRKLHNIANSVVILDEAQTLPVKLLVPTVAAINQLTRWYNASVVLSTATQPALENPFPAIEGVRDIIPDSVQPPPPRVQVKLPDSGKTEWAELAEQLADHDQVLCITHKRNDARDLTLALDEVLDDQSTIHLSANMCAAHRSDGIVRIRELLRNGEPCRVVSTQLVEAGVDFDFPVVYRALGGIDAMIQAAGRCNREGRLGDVGGTLHIFNPPTEPPRGLPAAAKEASELLLQKATVADEHLDLFSPDVVRRFFKELYSTQNGNMDGEGITAYRREFRFREVQRRYRLIEDNAHTVIVPWKDGLNRVDAARARPAPDTLRALQRYSVSVYDRELKLLESELEPLFQGAEDPSTWVLTNDGLYDDIRFGLVVAGTSTLTNELIT